jgi:uncharacterized protein YxjI
MKLLIKQRVFSWTDSYDVFDEAGNPKYFVKNEVFSLLHRIHVMDVYGNEIGMIRQKFTLFLPTFEIIIGGRMFGQIQRKLTLFRPKYDISYNGWWCEGDILAWSYDVFSSCGKALHISKKLFHWGDTYEIDIANPHDEIMALMLVIAIDAANCSQGNS